MNLTEDMLQRIANTIADLKLRVSIVGYLVAQQNPASSAIESIMKEAVESPDFQQFRKQIFEQLKGGH